MKKPVLSILILIVFALGLGITILFPPNPRSSRNDTPRTRSNFFEHKSSFVRPISIHCEELPNLFQVSEDIYSGGQPDAATGFRALKELGVKTVISVDGALPDVELAKEFGLRYVHLPHGYDGIDSEHAAQLAAAVEGLDGPVYIHCHHGKHRSPAAAAVVCIALNRWQPEQGVQFLKQAGTSRHYRGLYQSVATSSPLDKHLLTKTRFEFPSTAPPTPLVRSMVTLEKHLAAIQKMAQQGRTSLVVEPDLEPSHEALLLFEQFAELLRRYESKSAHEIDPNYRDLMNRSRQLAQQLYENIAAAPEAFPSTETGRLIGLLRKDCRNCHQAFRD